MRSRCRSTSTGIPVQGGRSGTVRAFMEVGSSVRACGGETENGFASVRRARCTRA